MNYATVGTSWITEKFISSAKTVNNMNFYAVYSRSKKKAKEFSQKYNIKHFYTDLNTLANDSNIDAVYIASPNVCHYEQSKFLLESGKNVICEKPATSTKEEMEELIKLAESKNLIYTEAIMTIHTEGFNIIQKNLKSLGKIYNAHFDFYQLSSKYSLYTEGKNPNIFNPEMHTGCLMDIGVYNLYLAVGLFGKPTKIISDAVMLSNGCDASGSCILKYDNLSVVLNYSKVGQTYSKSEIIGDCGTILFSSVSQLTGISFTHKETTNELYPEDISRDKIMSGEIEFFVKMCDCKSFTDNDYIFSKETALTVREICDTIRKQNEFLF